MFWIFIIGFAVIYGVNTVLALRQAKDFTNAFADMRRHGKVAIGKRKGLVSSGAIVMFGIDEAGRITAGRRLSGVTVFSRFRPFDAYNGIRLPELDVAGEQRLPKAVRHAVANARENYLLVCAGRQAPEPPGPITQVGNSLKRLVRRPVTA